MSVCVPEASMAVCEKPNPDPEGEEGWSQYRAGYPLLYVLLNYTSRGYSDTQGNK